MAKGLANASDCKVLGHRSPRISSQLNRQSEPLVSPLDCPRDTKNTKHHERKHYSIPIRLAAKNKSSLQQPNPDARWHPNHITSQLAPTGSTINKLEAKQVKLNTTRRQQVVGGGHLSRAMGSHWFSVVRLQRGKWRSNLVRSASILVSLVLAIVLQNNRFCSCDRTTAESLLPTKAQSPSMLATASSLATKTNSDPKEGAKLKSLATDSQTKHNLLSTLADQIERQHYKLTVPSLPKLSIGYHGSSKFDRDTAYPFADLRPLDASFKLKNKQSEQADDSIRKIMAMHETGIKTVQQATATGGSSTSAGSSDRRPAALSSLRKLRKLSASSSLPVIASLEPVKMASKMLAYVSPLVVAKLTDASLLSPSSSSLRRPRLQSFKARSLPGANETSSLLGGLFGSQVTGLPQTSSLARPQSSASDLLAQTPASISKASSFNDAALNDLLAESSELLSAALPFPLQLDSGADKQLLDQSSQSVASSAPNTGNDGKPDKEATKVSSTKTKTVIRPGIYMGPSTSVATKLKQSANHVAQNYFKNSFRDLITLSQLPILSTASSMTSTAPSVLETNRRSLRRRHNKPSSNGKPTKLSYLDQRQSFIEELYRYIYLLGTGVRNKRDPLEALGSSSKPKLSHYLFNRQHVKGALNQRSVNQQVAVASQDQLIGYAIKIRDLLSSGPLNQRARPRGVMWDMATDPSLAVTVFHLLERASVALPLGFLLLPFVKMIRHPLNGINLGRIIPAKASHRSIDIEELAKRLDSVDKMLSRALRSTHRETLLG